MLPKETLLDLIRTCSIFMDVGKIRAKVVARYQQYRAVCKIIDRLRKGETPNDRSGVIWHTQGSGKSLTMVFVIRKLRMCDDLKDYKVCLVNDRTDLEDQLGDTAALTGEKVTFITSSHDLKQRLATDSSNLNMVMLHKFNENPNRDLPDYLQDVIDLPKYESFGLVNDSERILLMIDEAHRSQSGDLGDNLFEAFPEATRLAFTGTPLIVVTDKKKTIERFGKYIDKYRLQDAVDDGVTVQILYEGKTADSAMSHKSEFDDKVNELAEQHIASQMRKDENKRLLRKIAKRTNRKFDDLVKERTADEIAALKKKLGTSDDLFEAEPRIKEIASDLVGHYIANILPNGFKAQVVCSSKLAAVRYKKFIDEAVAERLAIEEAKPILPGGTYRDIRYTLKRSDRKTASIYVERDGQITLIAPEGLTKPQIEKVLEGKRRWIYKNLAEWQDLNATRTERKFVNGEGFLYLGRSYRLKLVAKQGEPLVLKDGYFCLRTALRSSDKAIIAFRDFYRDKGYVRINERVSYFQVRMGVEPKSVKILDLQNRWASWTPGGNINFHWKCMMAPMKILDYIVVHELAHLLFPNHSAQFWNEVDKMMPDFQERKEWLREHGAGMDI